MMTQTDREGVSDALWKAGEYHIIAEWICCEPLEPGHDLCAEGYAALGMARTMLVDGDPEELMNPAAPVLDVVMRLMDDRAHAEAEKLRAQAEKMLKSSMAGLEPLMVMRAADAYLTAAHTVDPYEMRDGQLVRKADGEPVAM